MLVPKDQSQGRVLDDFDAVLEHRKSENGHWISLSLVPKEKVEPDEAYGISGERVFNALVHGLFFEYAQEKDIGTVDSLDSYIENIAELLKEIEERGTATIPERMKGLVH